MWVVRSRKSELCGSARCRRVTIFKAEDKLPCCDGHVRNFALPQMTEVQDPR